MHTIDFMSPTGSAWVGPRELKAGWPPGDPAARDIIDAPEWVPTGSQRVSEYDSGGVQIRTIYGEELRPGCVLL